MTDDQYLRMKALELAVGDRSADPNGPAADTVTTAQQYYDFLKAPPTPPVA